MHRSDRRFPRRAAVALPAWLLGALAGASALALLAPLGWPFELFVHFRVQYAAAAAVLAVLLGWRRQAVPAVLAVLLAAWHAYPFTARALAEATPQACAGPGFTVATVNVWFRNDDHDAVARWLGAARPDLVIVQEVTSAWADALSTLDAYPHRYWLEREDAYGIGVLSRWPLESVAPVDLVGDGLPSLSGVVTIDGQRLRFLGLHTHWPVLPKLAQARDAALQQAAAMARAPGPPLILLGDLNLTPDSPAYARLLQASGLRDVMDGHRWRPTWQAGFWPLALRIDHVFVPGELCVEQADVGPALGSDHRPVIARLRGRGAV